jgi:branched-chain amino acid transport system substrate-binding protein
MQRTDFLTGLGGSTLAATLPGYTATSTIGVVAPFSGRDRQLGERLADGVRAAIDDTNRTRGMLDRAYAMRTFDDGNTVANALVNAQFATGDSSVIAVVGHLSSAATLAAIPTYAGAQMPLIVPVATDDRVTATNYRDVFRLPTKDSSEGALFARFAAAQYHPKTASVFVQDADYGADVATGFISAMQGLKIAAPYTQFGYEKPDFDKVVDGALTAKPDYVFLAGTVGDMGGIIRSLRAKGYTGPIGAPQGFFDAQTMQLGPPANDLVVSTSVPYLAMAPSTQRVRTDFETRYGALGPLSLFGYAAAQVAIAGVRRSGAQARNALLSALQVGVPIDTIAGTFTFGSSGDPLDPQIYFYTMRDGKFAYLRQAHSSAFMVK